MASYKPVTAVLRGLVVLRAVSVQRRASVKSIQALTKINRPTVIRMLETLEHAGFIIRETSPGHYLVTGKALELSMGFEMSSALAAAAQCVIEALQRKIGWPSDVGVFDTDAMVVAATNRSSEGRFFYDRRPGYRAPLLGTSLGLAYIAFTTEEEREAAFASLRSSADPWNEIARDRDRAVELLRVIRKTGYATTDLRYTQREYDGKVISFGVPIMNGTRPMGALNVTYLREALTRAEAEKRLLPPLKKAATDISANLTLGTKSTAR